ncbi:putative cytochrome P450 oxidoreductase [Mytilinidion resinicola]|uniref:Cytochrome P450 oxidoreductase n=1 Tax=Mytilinidion resinicola TaxID=574789 RepID=A0A6A6Z331_9PEZI|nr:putative cytochrome P450 oxidoreductase [Mytilinidion resinicola]KAF2815541.1 putative cytochrome P450 oxidoreductase [Mytilinidion resinicola]
MAYTAVTPALVVLALSALIYRVLQIGKRDPRMPKGPPTLPVIGNIHQIPSTGLFKQFRQWAKEYGSIFSLKVGPSNIIVLCDRKAIHKLLVEKGSIYSDRPPSYVGWLLTKGDHLALEQMDAAWREKRKIIAHNFSPKQLDEKHFRVQEAEATVLMTNLLDRPGDFFQEIQRYTASVVSSINYGFRAKTHDSFWGTGVYDVMGKWTECMEPGANPPVDDVPLLKYIPASFAFWKQRAIDAGKTMDGTWGKARRLVEERRARGDRRVCIIDSLLDEYEKKGWPPSISQHSFTNLMGEIVEGGADTTSAQLLTLILAFALYPEVQRKARKEIDEVCGTERAPLWSDFSRLPYMNCIIKEGMRWRPVAVTALPHRVRQDDEYEGMLIPKDSTVFIPTWAIHHTDAIYEDSEKFNPDRYLNHPKLANDYAGSPDWENRDHYNYGAGRRICPGIHLAERNMWRIAAKLLWAFEFSEPVDPITRKVSHLDPEAYNPGILQAPLPFKVDIKVRSEKHVEIIRKEQNEALDFLKQYD